jgi:hypothetical protein
MSGNNLDVLIVRSYTTLSSNNAVALLLGMDLTILHYMGLTQVMWYGFPVGIETLEFEN